MANVWQSITEFFSIRRNRMAVASVVALLTLAIVGYLYYSESQNQPNITFETGGVTLTSQRPVDQTATVDPTSGASQASSAVTGSSQTPVFSQNWQLKIDRLGINAPVAMDVDPNSKETYFKALEDGVAHMLGTAWPGEGNTVIFGHSSFYVSQPGNYKTIFATLDRMQTGDKITLSSSSKTLTYIVTGQTVVPPSQVDVLSPTKDTRLTLFTCWPPKTVTNRLVVTATLQE